MLEIKIDYDALEKNVKVYKSVISASLCAVIKQNAYNHGLKTALTLCELSNEVAVFNENEAYDLVKLGVTKPINVLSPCDAKLCANYKNVNYSVSSLSDLKRLKNIKGGINVKIDTGMNRFGASELTSKQLLKSVKSARMIYTHFYNAENVKSAKLQFARFMQVANGINCKLSCCASNAIFLPRYMHLDLCRVGIGLYGYGDERLFPALSAYAKVLCVKKVRAGENVGYGNCVLPYSAQIAIINVGYGCGFTRTNCARYVAICDKLCKVVGQVCMNCCAVDVSGLNVKENDVVEVVGKNVPLQTLCASQSTISYETLCRLRDTKFS